MSGSRRGDLPLSRYAIVGDGITAVAGETCWLCLTHGASPLDDVDAATAIDATLEAWERWSAKGHYPEPYHLTADGPGGAPAVGCPRRNALPRARDPAGVRHRSRGGG